MIGGSALEYSLSGKSVEMGWHCGGSPSFRLGDLSPSPGFIANGSCCVLSVCHGLG